MAKRVLLTGGSGYLGANIVRKAIKEGHDILLLHRESSTFEIVDHILADIDWRSKVTLIPLAEEVKQCDQFISLQPDIILHAATCGGYDYEASSIDQMLKVNIRLGWILLEALHQLQSKDDHKRAFIFCGSYWQHSGKSDAYLPNSLYAATKTAFESIASFYGPVLSYPVMGLKFYDIYGPHDPRQRLLSLLIESLTKTEPLKISAGEQKISLLHVDDAVEAVFNGINLLLSEKTCNFTYGVPGPDLLSIKEIVKILEQISGRSVNVDWGARAYRDREIHAPYILPSMPNWRPKISVHQGILQLLNILDA